MQSLPPHAPVDVLISINYCECPASATVLKRSINQLKDKDFTPWPARMQPETSACHCHVPLTARTTITPSMMPRSHRCHAELLFVSNVSPAV